MTPRQPTTTTLLAARIAHAASPYMSTPAALELANNVCCFDPEDITEENVADSIRRRMQHFGVACGDVQLCAAAMVRTARRHQARRPARAA